MKSLLVILFCLWLHIYKTESRIATYDKREWAIKLCRSNENCGGGCCKGFLCFRYLKEGEKCLIEDHLNIGCGCADGLECTQQKFPWAHTCVRSTETLERELDDYVQHDSELLDDINAIEVGKPIIIETKNDNLMKSETKDFEKFNQKKENERKQYEGK